MITCRACGKKRPHCAHGLCKTCYNHRHPSPVITCRECKRKRPHHARGLCETCYRRRIITCRTCGRKRPHYARGLCKMCYPQPIITCRTCGRKRPHAGLGLCDACYVRQHARPMIVCRNCGRHRPHHSRGLCNPCARTVWKHLRGVIPKHKVRGHLAHSWRGGRRVYCTICGRNAGWRNPNDFHRNKTGFRCRLHKHTKITEKNHGNQESTPLRSFVA